jgi:hypothetical protein
MSGPAPATPAGPAASRPRPRLGLVVAVVVVVAVVILAAILLLHLFGSSGASSASLTFRAAEAEANQTAARYDSGAYSRLALAEGLHISSSLTANLTGPGSADGCLTNLLVGKAVGLPASSDPPGGGTASLWEFLYQSSAQGFLSVLVSGGQAEAVYTASASCAPLIPGFGTPLAGVIDSSTAAADANTVGGSTYLSAHPSASAVYLLALGGSPLPGGPVWLVGYTDCPLSPLGGVTGTIFSASLNASSGRVLGSAAENVTCSPVSLIGMSSAGATPLDAAFALGSPFQEVGTNATEPFCSAGDYCDVLPVQSVGGGLVADNLLFAIQSPSGGQLDYSGARISVESPTGLVSATYQFSGSSWTVNATLHLSTVYTFVLDLGCPPSSCSPTPAGEVLVAYGANGFSGQVDTTLA